MNRPFATFNEPEHDVLCVGGTQVLMRDAPPGPSVNGVPLEREGRVARGPDLGGDDLIASTSGPSGRAWRVEAEQRRPTAGLSQAAERNCFRTVTVPHPWRAWPVP